MLMGLSLVLMRYVSQDQSRPTLTRWMSARLRVSLPYCCYISISILLPLQNLCVQTFKIYIYTGNCNNSQASILHAEHGK